MTEWTITQHDTYLYFFSLGSMVGWTGKEINHIKYTITAIQAWNLTSNVYVCVYNYVYYMFIG